MLKLGGKYTTYVMCSNCTNRSLVWIPVGMPVDDFLEEMNAKNTDKCVHCECNALIIRYYRWLRMKN